MNPFRYLLFILVNYIRVDPKTAITELAIAVIVGWLFGVFVGRLIAQAVLS